MKKASSSSPPSPASNAKDPFNDDQLGRRKLVDRLMHYIDRSAESVVIGIDAPWGEGKSWFGRHWMAKLGTGYRVGFIDAFESDYVEDPFTLIASELSDLVKPARLDSFKTKAGAVMLALAPIAAKATVNLIGRATVGLSSEQFSESFKESVTAASDSGAAGIEKMLVKRIDLVKAEKNSIKAFKKLLTEIAVSEKAPMIVFIDELDRCKPSFAVTLIERIKHLFDIPNLVFILLLNRSQLQSAIAGVYGAGVDGQAYLGKFVHLWFELPTLSAMLKRHPTYAEQFVRVHMQKYDVAIDPHFLADMTVWTEAMSLSLRDIERACALHVLSENPSAVATYLVVLKVKDPVRFAGVRRGERAVLLETAQWLDKLAATIFEGTESGTSSALLQGIAVLHRREAGDETSKDPVDPSGREPRRLAGSWSNSDHPIASTANMIDLPIGR